MEKYFNTVFSAVGRPVPGALIEVEEYPSGDPVTLYSDDGVTPIVGDLVSDARGFFEFFVDAGRYNLIYSKDGVQIRRVDAVRIYPDPQTAIDAATAAAASATEAEGYKDDAETASTAASASASSAASSATDAETAQAAAEAAAGVFNPPYINLRAYAVGNMADAQNMFSDPDVDTIVFDKALTVSADFTVNSRKRIIIEPKATLTQGVNSVATNSKTGADGRVAKALFWVTAENVVIEQHGIVDLSPGSWAGGGNRHLAFALGAHGLTFNGTANIIGAFNSLALIDTDDFLVKSIRALAGGSPNAAIELIGCYRGDVQFAYAKDMEETIDFNGECFETHLGTIIGVDLTQNALELSNCRGVTAENVVAQNCSPLSIFDYPIAGTQYGWSDRFSATIEGLDNKVKFWCYLDSNYNGGGNPLVAINSAQVDIDANFRIVSPSVMPIRLMDFLGGAYGGRQFPTRIEKSKIKFFCRTDISLPNDALRVRSASILDIYPTFFGPATSGPIVNISESSPDVGVIYGTTIHDPTIISSGGTATGVNIGGSLSGTHRIVGRRTYTGLGTNENTASVNTASIEDPYRLSTHTINPASIAAGASWSTSLTVSGAELGQRIEASFNQDMTGGFTGTADGQIDLRAAVRATNSVRVTFKNDTPNVIDLPSGTLTLRRYA